MSISTEELIRSLTESGVLSDDDLVRMNDLLSDLSGAKTAEALAIELVRQNLLTKLQAGAILKGKLKNLVFGEYIVVDKIGSGGMGQVFKARHRPTGKLVALKVLSADAVKNRRMIERFKKEARAVARLKHPNIVRAYEAGKINRIRYLVMELVEGENMLARVKRKGPLSIDECVSCLLQAARGLDYAHQKGIIHRDIKPSNLLRDRHTARVKVLDMGLARVDEPGDEGDLRLTMPGQMLGTARFMSPEQVEDARESDVRSDVYSLGCTLHFLLRGKAPYSGETVAHTLMAHISAPIPDLCAKRKDVPRWLGDVFQKMLAKNPKDRFQTMGELVAVVQKHLGDEMTKDESVNVLDDEPGNDDEYSKILAGRGDVGASLAEIYLEDEDEDEAPEDAPPRELPEGEQFEMADRSLEAAPEETEDEDASTGIRSDRDQTSVMSGSSGFTDRSSKASATDDLDLETFEADSEDGSDELQRLTETRLRPESQDEIPVTALTAAQPFRLAVAAESDALDSVPVAVAPELNDYVKSKQAARQAQARASARRLQIAGLVFGGVAAFGLALWFLLK